MGKAVPESTFGFGFGLRAMKNFPELIPLVTILGGACVMASTFVGYALWQKPDVKINRNIKEAVWERVNPETPQKLLTFNIKYEKNEELEKLRKEIGSYKC